MLIYSPHATFHASAVAPKKLAKTAVMRNKFRRRVYDVFERTHKATPLAGVFICVAKEGAPQNTYETLTQELLTLIHKTKTLELISKPTMVGFEMSSKVE